jgi:two-component system chemotaxis sensor kinase CheA
MDMNQYIDLFIDEAREHLQSISDSLLELERDPENLEVINTIFRSAHTIKGMAASMGFEQMAQLTHQMENGLDQVRAGAMGLNEAAIDALFACADALEAQLQAIVEQGSEASVDVSTTVSRLTAAFGSEAAEVMAAADKEEATDKGEGSLNKSAPSSADRPEYRVLVRFHETCAMPAVRAYMVYQALQGVAEVRVTTPSVEDLMQGRCGEEFTIELATDANPERIREVGLSVTEVADVAVTPLSPPIQDGPTEAAAQMAAAATAPTSSTETAGAPESGRMARADRQSGKSPLVGRATREPARDGGGRVRMTRGRGGQSIRVDLERLDAVINRFSEFVIDKTRLQRLAEERQDPDLMETVRHLGRVCDEMQDLLLRIRMLPVETVFQRFPRMVRDLSKTLGKRVELTMEGMETELDRTVMDEIGDALVHILRNALDHGLESPEERRQAGKPETGRVRLLAYQSGDDVFIEVIDDGRGLNRDRILEKAAQLGLVDPAQAAQLEDEEVYEFLFHSGFSTANQVSDISGRGVGLDAVRNTIRGLGGDVLVQSRLGEGTRFILQVPLTLSILQAMLVQVGDERYAIPLSSLVQIHQLEPESVREVNGRRLIEFRSRLVPLLDARDLLELPARSQDGEPWNVAILSKGDRWLALVVDEFLDTQEVVIKPLGAYFRNGVYGIAGATILGDGQVVLIVDVAKLIR